MEKLTINRCGWVKLSNPLYVTYHDQEWGRPVHDDRHLFEMLCLEGQQAGVSWEVVLNKRGAYRKVFYNFDIKVCAELSDEYLESQITNPDIIRSKNKIYSIRGNAQAVQTIIAEYGSLDKYLWSFVDHKIINNSVESYKDAPTQTLQSAQLSKSLKTYGCKFLGPTICYAFMQAVGMVNDHENTCTCKNNHL
jgi:DNA-3-methyladenine glycosylase I